MHGRAFPGFNTGVQYSFPSVVILDQAFGSSIGVGYAHQPYSLETRSQQRQLICAISGSYADIHIMASYFYHIPGGANPDIRIGNDTANVTIQDYSLHLLHISVGYYF